MNANSPQTRDPAELDRFFQPVLDVAVLVARERSADDGVSAVPTRLRPFLRVAKLPKAGLAAARLALEEDSELRAAVAERIEESEVGRGPWLWVSRPDGWRSELEGEWELWRDQQQQRVDAEAERSSTRLLERATETAQRLAGRVEQLEALLGAAEAETAVARAEAAASAAERDTATEELQRRVTERAEAVRQLKHTEDLLATRTAELREVEDLLAEDGAEAPEPVVVDRDELAEAVRHAASQLDPLVRSLQRLADLVGLDLSAQTNEAAVAPKRRRAARLGRGIAAESTRAAEVLLALGGAVVFIDGYNVTMTVWPTLTATDQRRALERSVASLAARTGAEMHVVYDGDGTVGAPARSSGSAVRVRFTAVDVEADDEILDLIASVALERPVIVVSDDRRVQSGARRRGANVVGSRQLQPLLLR